MYVGSLEQLQLEEIIIDCIASKARSIRIVCIFITKLNFVAFNGTRIK